MNYGKLTAGTTKTAIDTAKPSEKGEIITYLSRMGDVLNHVPQGDDNSGVGILRGEGIEVLVDSNEADIPQAEILFDVVARVDGIPPQPGEVFHNNAVY